MKKFIVSLLAVVLVLSSTMLSFSSSTDQIEQFGSTDISASKAMTYEELIQYHADRNGLSFVEAEKEVNPDGVMNPPRTRARDLRYKVLSITLNVTSSYKPSLDLYVVADYWNSYWAIDHIYYVTMNRGYNGISKQFGGEIAVWNRGNNKIQYIVNGDFYNNGTTSAGVNVNIGVGEKASVGFSVSNSSNHYKYFYVSNTKTWAGN
ncbi:Uncharacterised protein [uncultured Eubacterium sp.]|nr:Uncharacterised protein [uncultured Eubacterium sp.]